MSNATPGAPQPRRYEVEVPGHDRPFVFNVTLAEFQKFQREAQRDVAMAISNFLLTTSTERDRFKSASDEQWGLPAVIMEALTDQLLGVRGAHLKNSNGA
jgi:hypothetical protein